MEAKLGDEDVKGSGLFHCNCCVRYFETQVILEEHERSKAHKKNKRKQNWEEEMAAKEASTLPKRIRRTSGAQNDLEMKEAS